MFAYRTRFALRTLAQAALGSPSTARGGFTSYRDPAVDPDDSDYSTDDFPENDDDESDYSPSESSEESEPVYPALPAKRARHAEASLLNPLEPLNPSGGPNPAAAAPDFDTAARPAKFARVSAGGRRAGALGDESDSDVHPPQVPAGTGNQKQRRRNRDRRKTPQSKELRKASWKLKVVENVSVVKTQVDVASHGNAAGFITPPRFKSQQCAPTGPALPQITLHPDVHADARRLVVEGFTYVRPGDDGIQFTDKNDVVFAAVAKRRTDQDYVDLINRCFERAGELRRKCDSPNAKKNPRGAFSRAQYGTSFGGGQKEPTPISNGKRVTQAMVEFMTLDDTREMTGILA
ncbi:hypothetical protein AURDEDRAFT_131910, partial [Auricularia subglabra TFB-10046 SS5]